MLAPRRRQGRTFYRSKESEAKILATDPNAHDLDPGPFYDMIISELELQGKTDDSPNAVFGGLGGTIAETIAAVKAMAKKKGKKKKPKAGDAGEHEMLELYFTNVGLQKPFEERDLKVTLDMFVHELRPELAQLKREAKKILDGGRFDAVVAIARKKKVPLSAEQVEMVLRKIVAAK
jgi:hypothetical protein